MLVKRSNGRGNRTVEIRDCKKNYTLFRASARNWGLWKTVTAKIFKVEGRNY